MLSPVNKTIKTNLSYSNQIINKPVCCETIFLTSVEQIYYDESNVGLKLIEDLVVRLIRYCAVRCPVLVSPINNNNTK